VDDEPHLPPPTLWPLGFAIGIAVVLVGLIVDPLVISSIGGAIAIVFGILWARDATAGLRAHQVVVEPERRELVEAGAGETGPPANVGRDAMPHPAPGERFPRSKFLEGATLGLGGVIGGLITVPVAGFAVLPGFLGQKRHEVDMGPVADYKEGQWYIATFMTNPAEGEVTRRTAYIRNNGDFEGEPSFTIISNRCAHLGCPVQPNGPVFDNKKQVEHMKDGNEVTLIPMLPAGGFGCPCHGGQYNSEGNRTAGPPVRSLDRYDYSIIGGHLVLGNTYSVGKVDGTGAQAKIHRYGLANPGNHVDGPEAWLYPLQPPH